MFSYAVYTTTIPLHQIVFHLVNLSAAHTFPLCWHGLALPTCAPVCEASIVIRDSNIDDIFQTTSTYQLVLFNLQASSSSLSSELLSIVDELSTVPKGSYWYGSNSSASAFVYLRHPCSRLRRRRCSRHWNSGVRHRSYSNHVLHTTNCYRRA